MKRIRPMIAAALLAVIPVLMQTSPVHAYIDLAPTFSRILSDAPTILLVEVDHYDRQSHTVSLKPVRTLKGAAQTGLIQHVVAPTGGAVQRQIVQWATPGSRGVLFVSRTTSLLCYGTGWYQVRSSGSGPWRIGADRPDLPLAYYGSVSRLVEAVDALLQNKPAVITVVAFGTDSEGAMFDLALNRQALPGVVRIQRIRATANMPGNVMGASSNPVYLIGPGYVDEHDIPALLERLDSTDVTIRAEAAADLRSLGRKARSAAPALANLLNDAAPRARFVAASALLRVAPKDPQIARALAVLTDGLGSADLATRRYAARSAGFAGPAGAPLGEKLSALLSDSDEAVRLNALESISTLGPAAEKAVDALIPLLDAELAIDAADALGRIGAAAQPALKKLTPMLDSSQASVRWAAVRAMAQIGGPDARPAVDFMIRQFSNANEYESYNMMIFLALLGDVAQDAGNFLQNVRIKNPVLPMATAWAISPTRGLPWGGGGGMGRGGRGGRGGMGGPGGDFGGGMMMGGGPGGGMADLGTLIFQAYVNELGTRLRPTAPLLARAIMDNTAGNVPTWGYRMLAAGPDLSLDILTPYLANENLELRERATVALGYMGSAAEAAIPQLEETLARSTNPREQRLIQWAIRQINEE